MLLPLLVGCGTEPRLDGVVPASGSARGGDRVCLEGADLPARPVVRFDGVRAPAAGEDDAGRPCVSTPPHLAGPVTVQVALPEAPPQEAGFDYLPLELVFVEAAAHFVPGSAVGLAGGVRFDADGDGHVDVVVRDRAGGVAVWRSGGQGALSADAPLPIEGPVAGLAVVPWGEGEALFACLGDGEAARLFAPQDGLLREVEGAVPVEAGACRGAAGVDLDGDGRAEAVELRTDGTLRAWTAGDDGLVRWTAGPAADAESCGALSTSEGTASDCIVLEGTATLWAQGPGEAALVLPLPAVDRADDGFELRVGGDLSRLDVVDAAGQVFSWAPTGVGEDLGRLDVPPVGTWTTDLVPVPPLQRLHVVVPGGSSGANAVDLASAVLRFPDGGRAAALTTRAWPVDARVAATVLQSLDADEDGVPELVAGTAEGPVLLRAGLDGFDLTPDLQGVPCAVGDLVPADVDGDGRPELALACAGQDRLLRGDGTGAFFDDTVATLPVDAGDGRGVAAADLDLDGLPELIIATVDGVDRLYHGDGARFEDWSARLGLRVGSGMTPLVLDVDEDGDQDLLILQGEPGEGAPPARLLIMTGD